MERLEGLNATISTEIKNSKIKHVIEVTAGYPYNYIYDHVMYLSDTRKIILAKHLENSFSTTKVYEQFTAEFINEDLSTLTIEIRLFHMNTNVAIATDSNIKTILEKNGASIVDRI